MQNLPIGGFVLALFPVYNEPMLFLGTAFFFLFGTIAGSFLNVWVLRHGASGFSGRPVCAGRSRCLSCGKALVWLELIPLLSFFFQRGRCRSCRSRISLQYPLVELITGLVFAAIFWKEAPSFSALDSLFLLPPSSFLLLLALWSELIAITVYDLRHKIIPDSFVYGFIFLSFLYLLLSSLMLHPSSLIDFAGGPFLALFLASVWFFSRGRAVGLGDAKLALGLGWFLGAVGGLSAFVLGFWLGAFFASAALALRFVSSRVPFAPALKSRLKNLTMKSELPLAPFLIAGTLIVYLTGVDVTGLGMLLSQ